MIRRLTLLCALGALLASAATAATAQAASIWTPVSSGTSSTITSIVYQSPTRFWYATSSGTIASWNGSSFTPATGITPGENFVDMAFQPTSTVSGGPGTAGLTGYAVTSNGHLWRSTDGGENWAQRSAPPTRDTCSGTSVAQFESELNAVQWANTTTVFLMGNGSTILRSTNANAASPLFAEANKVVSPSNNCAIQNEGFPEDFTDAT
ncbi:MAG TPA: hypothetical protein VGG07_05355, partial [Solirubrobacteraceae bacterium]